MVEDGGGSDYAIWDDAALDVLRGLSSLLAVARRACGCSDAGILASADCSDPGWVRLISGSDGVPSLMLLVASRMDDPMESGRLLIGMGDDAKISKADVKSIVHDADAGGLKSDRGDRDYAHALGMEDSRMPAVVRCLSDRWLFCKSRAPALRSIGRILSGAVGTAESMDGADGVAGYVAFVLSHVVAALACVEGSFDAYGLDAFKPTADGPVPNVDDVWNEVLPWLMMMRARGLDAESVIRYMGAMERSRAVSYDDVDALMGADVFPHMAGMYASSAARIVDADFLMVSDTDMDGASIVVRAVEAGRVMRGLSSLREEDPGESGSYAWCLELLDLTIDGDGSRVFHPLRVGFAMARHVAFGHVPYGVIVRFLTDSLCFGTDEHDWIMPSISVRIRDWDPKADIVSVLGFLDGVAATVGLPSSSGVGTGGMPASVVKVSMEYARLFSGRSDDGDPLEPSALDALRGMTRYALKHAEDDDAAALPAWWRFCHLLRMVSRRFGCGTISDGACPLIRWSVLREAVEGFRLSGLPLDYCVETIGADVRMIPMDDAPGFRERGDGDGADGGGRPVLLAVDPSFMDRLGVDDPRIMLIALDE